MVPSAMSPSAVRSTGVRAEGSAGMGPSGLLFHPRPDVSGLGALGRQLEVGGKVCTGGIAASDVHAGNAREVAGLDVVGSESQEVGEMLERFNVQLPVHRGNGGLQI